MINILLFDNHLILGAALQELIDHHEGCKVVALANDQDTLFKLLKQHQPEMLVMNLVMPWEGGLDFFKQIMNGLGKVGVLVISTLQEDDFALRLLKIGVGGFLTPNDTPKKLFQAITIVSRGEKFFNKRLTTALFDRLLDGRKEIHHTKLSDREYDIFLQLAFGHSISAISKNLHISDKTVSTYKARIMKKMNFSSLTDLIKYAIKQRLLS